VTSTWNPAIFGTIHNHIKWQQQFAENVEKEAFAGERKQFSLEFMSKFADWSVE
jgi:hypothetical protein